MGEFLTLGKVKALVSESVLKRGQEIEASDKLRGVAFEGGEDVLTARADCVGSSPSDIYVVKVSVNGSEPVGDCSCPAGKNAFSGLCKHVIAVLLRHVKESQRLHHAPSTSTVDEEVVRVSAQVDDVALSAGNVVGAGPSSSALSRSRVVAASSSKRALPTWMVGVAGSAGEAGSPPRSKKRPTAPNPPRPVGAVRKKARRAGFELKIANDGDGAEDPGVVEDAKPVEQGLGAGAVEKPSKVSEAGDRPSAGALARERRRLKEQKKDVKFAFSSDDEEGGRDGVRRSTRPAAKRTAIKPVEPRKRRLKKKFVAEDSDLSENEPSPIDSDTETDFRLTDDDLMLLAQEQLHGENAKPGMDNRRRDAKEGSSKVGDLAENAKQGMDNRRQDAKEGSSKVGDLAENGMPQRNSSSSIFSINTWKHVPSSQRVDGLWKEKEEDPHELDMETLMNLSKETSSQAPAHVDMTSTAELLPHFIPEQSLKSKADHLSVLAPPADQKDAIADDMLSIIFGAGYDAEPSSTSGAQQACEPRNPLVPDMQNNHLTTEIGGRTGLSDCEVQPRPKKKSSLKDQMKILFG